MTNLLKRGWDALFHPTIRLAPDFPLTGKALGKAYFIGLLWFTAGNLIPLLLLVVYVLTILLVRDSHPDIARQLCALVVSDDGNFRQSVLAAFVLVPFISGFWLELRYFARVLRRSGHTLTDCIGLSLAPLRQSTWLATAWAVLWRVLLAYLLVQGSQQLLGMLIAAPEQPTVTFAKMLSGEGFLAFAVLAVVFAPLLEEIAFRGFLFQALRATLHNWRKDALAGAATPTGMRARLTTWLGATLFASETRVDVGAIVLSSAVFSLSHLQFQPVTLLMLFGMGAVLAEIFRRTGTLWPGILLHAAVNGTATVLIWLAL